MSVKCTLYHFFSLRITNPHILLMNACSASVLLSQALYKISIFRPSKNMFEKHKKRQNNGWFIVLKICLVLWQSIRTNYLINTNFLQFLYDELPFKGKQKISMTRSLLFFITWESCNTFFIPSYPKMSLKLHHIWHSSVKFWFLFTL